MKRLHQLHLLLPHRHGIWAGTGSTDPMPLERTERAGPARPWAVSSRPSMQLVIGPRDARPGLSARRQASRENSEFGSGVFD